MQLFKIMQNVYKDDNICLRIIIYNFSGKMFKKAAIAAYIIIWVYILIDAVLILVKILYIIM